MADVASLRGANITVGAGGRRYDYWADLGRQLVSRTRVSSRQGAKLGGKMDTDPKTEKPTDFDLEIAVFGAP